MGDPKYTVKIEEINGGAQRILIDFERPIWPGKIKSACVQFYETPTRWSDEERFGALAKIMSIVFFEIQNKSYHKPHELKKVDGLECLAIRPTDILEYLRTTEHLSYEWKAILIRSPKQLLSALR